MAKVSPSVAVGGLSGTSGSCVFVRRRDGSVVLRQHTVPRDPGTPAQMAMRTAMRRAAAAFRRLDPDELRAWQAYAHRRADEAWAERRLVQVNAVNAFRTLALKALQIDPNVDLPRLPPETPFGGDSVRVVATAGSRAVFFAPTGSNAGGVVTELLLQPVRLSITTPDPRKFRSQAFVTFQEGGPPATVEAQPGWFVPAYRFVRAATGQTSPILLLDPILVTA